MLHSIFTLIIDAISSIFAETLLLRFWIQITQIRPPILVSQFIFQISNWIVKFIQKVLPNNIINHNWTSLLSAFLIALLSTIIKIESISQFTFRLIILLTIVRFLQWIFYGFITTLIAEIIFNWINPYAPLAPFFHALNQPLLHFLRKFIPFKNINLSPLAALILLQIVVHIINTLFFNVVK